MIRNKFFGKHTVVLAIAAASALVAGSASAGGVADVAARQLATSTTFTAYNPNNANTCARVYFNGKQYDLNKHHPSAVLRQVPLNKSIMASIFKGNTCGGAAIKNVWHTAARDAKAWTVQ